MSRKILERLSESTLVALRCAGGDWPRTLFSPTLIPDTWMGLVVRADGRRHFVPAGEDPHPETNDTLLLVRNRAITVPLEVSDVTAADGHDVSATVEILVRWMARDDELAALHRALLTDPELHLDRLAREIGTAGGTAALREFIRARHAQPLIETDVRDELLAALREALKGFLFHAGLTLERVGTLAFTSRSFREHTAMQRDAARRMQAVEARGAVEQAAHAATQRRLEGLSAILDKLHAATADHKTLRWHELLPALSPAERGQLLENLWRITPDQLVTQAIVVVTDAACLWLDPADPQRFARRVDLPKDLGGLRSITFAPQQRLLLIGAATGVWTLDADRGEVRRAYPVPDIDTARLGFNAATIAAERLFATHSQLGCWTWALKNPSDARGLLIPDEAGPSRVRAATRTADGRVLFSADKDVKLYNPQTETLTSLGEALARVQSLATLDNLVFIGTEDARVYRVDLAQPEDWTMVHSTPVAAESIVARRWSDLVELIVPAGPRGVIAIYEEQNVTATLMKSATPIRRVWAGDDLVVGMNDLRDRLIVLTSAGAGRTDVEVPLARMLSDTIQDACLVTQVPSPATA